MQVLAGGQRQHICDPTGGFDFDASATFSWINRDTADQGAQLGDRLLHGMVVAAQRFGQHFDLRAIVVGDAGVQGDDGAGFQVGQLLGDRVAIIPRLRQNRADLDEFIPTIRDRVHQSIDLGGRVAVPAFQLGPLLADLLRSPAAAFVKFADIG